jgi:hypothetical protein
MSGCNLSLIASSVIGFLAVSCANHPPAAYYPPPVVASTNPAGVAHSGLVGLWSGVCADEKISIRFGANGSLILTNSHETISGSWTGAGSRFKVTVGESLGNLVIVNGSTASLDLDGAHAELKKAIR